MAEIDYRPILGLGPEWIACHDEANQTYRAWNLYDVFWCDAPRPHRWHHCRPQTVGLVRFGRVERCACGAIRYERFRGWMQRNSRRKTNG